MQSNTCVMRFNFSLIAEELSNCQSNNATRQIHVFDMAARKSSAAAGAVAAAAAANEKKLLELIHNRKT
jgi:hypothetical protein